MLEFRGEGDLNDDNIYIAEVGPKYLQYRLHHYTKGKVISECNPLLPGEEVFIALLGLQRFICREIRGSLELCGTNNSIVPEGQDSTLSIGLLHVKDGKRSGESAEIPWFVDPNLAQQLEKVKAVLPAAGWSEDGSLVYSEIEVEAYHPDPEILGETPRPHLGFSIWNRKEKSLTLYLLPLYSHDKEYSRSLEAGTLYMLTKARIGSEPTTRDLRKTYKKLSRTIERAGLPRVEGGAKALLDWGEKGLYILPRKEDEKVALGNACTHCNPHPESTMAGLEVLLNSLESGSYLVL